jgi:TRAP-type C4-dicarboxylate transport system permease small subunit
MCPIMPTLIDRLVGWVLAACLGVMTCVVFVSVVFRYILNSPLTWSEELASLLFAWLTFVGAYVGFRTHSHIRIDTVTMFLPATVRRGVLLLADVGVLFLLLVFIWQGFSLVATTWSLEFPAMEISRGYLYVSLPIGACLMLGAILLSWRVKGSDSGGKEEG